MTHSTVEIGRGNGQFHEPVHDLLLSLANCDSGLRILTRAAQDDQMTETSSRLSLTLQPTDCDYSHPWSQEKISPF